MKLRRLEKRLIASILTICLTLGLIFSSHGEIMAKAEEMEQNPYSLSNPTKDADGNVTWDCVWFGSYPQTEIVSEEDKTQLAAMEKMNTYYETKYETVSASAYQQIADASYNSNGDATVNGVKYRRMKKGDAISSEFENNCYYQWNDSTSYHYFRYEPIKWRVLSIEGGDAFLLADAGLDNKRYNNKRYHKIYTGITWENTTIRSWLNGYSVANNKEGEDYSNNNFLCNAFSNAEQEAVCNSQLLNENNSEYGTDGGNSTIDKVFLLSISDALKTDYGFTMDGYNDIAKIAKTSTYAKAMGCCNYPDVIGCDGWWLRSLGETSDYAAWIGDGGYLCSSGNSINCDLAIRPALHLNLSRSSLYSYAGTVSTKEYSGSEEISSQFTLGTDNNSFIHANNTSSGGFYGITTYQLDDAYYKRLTRNSSRAEKNYIQDYMDDTWGGSCYGIASTMGLVYEDYMELGDLTDSIVADYYSLQKPKDDRKLLNTINYYQLSQMLQKGGKRDIAVSTCYNSSFYGDANWLCDYDSLSECLQKLVADASNEHVQVLGYSTEEGGHAILLTGCEYDEENECYKVRLYDENSVSPNDKQGEFSYMTIAKDYSSFALKEGSETINKQNFKYLYFTDFSKMSDLIATDFRKKDVELSQDNGRANIVFAADKAFTLTNSDGKQLKYDGESLSGDLPIYDMDTFVNDKDSDILIETDLTNDYTVTDMSGTDIKVYSGDDYKAVTGEDIESIELTMSEGVKLTGTQYSFKAYSSTDKELADNEGALVAFSGDAKGDVTISDVNGNANMVSASGVDNMVTTTYEAADRNEVKYTGLQKDVTVKTGTASSQDDTANKKDGNNNNQNAATNNNCNADKGGITNKTDNNKVSQPAVINTSAKVLSKVKGLKLKKTGSNKLKLSYKKVKDAKGYQISYSTNKHFAKAKKLIIKKNKYTIKKLEKGRTYYIRVRAYKLNGSKKVYGKWSSTRKIKVR